MKDYVNDFFRDPRFVLFDGRRSDSELRKKLGVETLPTRDLRILRSRYVCRDGYSFSVQAGPLAWCDPQGFTGPYTHVETSGLHQKQKVDDHVPVEIVNAIIEAHGGPDFEVMEQVGDGERMQLGFARSRQG